MCIEDLTLLSQADWANGRRYVTSIASELADEIDCEGWVYPGEVSIAYMDESGEYLLVIGNEDWRSENIEPLEGTLYQWYRANR